MDPNKLKDQLNFKNMLREKEAMVPIDDAKISRDHKRHFMVSRTLGHNLEITGSSEWQIMKESAQECWVCDRKQFTFMFWSPEFGDFEQSSTAWLTAEDKKKLLDIIFVDRETSNLREQRR